MQGLGLFRISNYFQRWELFGWELSEWDLVDHGGNCTGGRCVGWELSRCSLRLHNIQIEEYYTHRRILYQNKNKSRILTGGFFPWEVFAEPKLSQKVFLSPWGQLEDEMKCRTVLFHFFFVEFQCFCGYTNR